MVLIDSAYLGLGIAEHNREKVFDLFFFLARKHFRRWIESGHWVVEEHGDSVRLGPTRGY